jgi:hypothetical protein
VTESLTVNVASAATAVIVENAHLWSRELQQCSVLESSPIGIVAITDFGALMIDPRDGETRWSYILESDSLVSARISNDGSRVALGSGQGLCYVLSCSDGAMLASFSVALAPRKSSVDALAWSADDDVIAAAAGRTVVTASISDGNLLASAVCEAGSVYGIGFDINHHLAVCAYGRVSLLGDSLSTRSVLSIGAAAILSIAIPADRKCIAVGCLDKRVRMFRRDDNDKTPARDMVGFDAGVKLLRFNPSGSLLAAAGGSSLLLAPREWGPGHEMPILLCSCRRATAFNWASDRILVVLEGGSGRACVYNVAFADEAVPRRLNPTLVLSHPGPALAMALMKNSADSTTSIIISNGNSICGSLLGTLDD